MLFTVTYQLSYSCLKHNLVSNMEVTLHSEMVQKSCACLVSTNDMWIFILILQQPVISLLNYEQYMGFYNNISCLPKYFNGQNQTYSYIPGAAFPTLPR